MANRINLTIGTNNIPGVVFSNITSAVIEEPPNAYEDNIIFNLKNNEAWTGSFKLRKISRKRFKKLLMSSGVSRNKAEEACNLVSHNKGNYSYDLTYFMYVCGLVL